jgi:OOP family OmpA-OmpF porin
MRSAPLKTCLRAACLAVCIAGPAAHAEGLYAGGGLAVPHFGDNINGLSLGTSGVGGKLFGGYQLNPYFAVEAGLADLGNVSDATGSIRSHAEYIDGIGLLPLNASWSLLGSIGAANVHIDTSNGDDRGPALKLGLGAEYSLSKAVALRGEYENYHVNAFDSHPNIGQYSLGIRVNF